MVRFGMYLRGRCMDGLNVGDKEEKKRGQVITPNSLAWASVEQSYQLLVGKTGEKQD